MGRMLSFAPHSDASSNCIVEWESRYGGALAVALVGGESFAGISGPWPDGSFALTWWSTQRLATLPNLEFHVSMETAKERVETIAYQIGRPKFQDERQEVSSSLSPRASIAAPAESQHVVRELMAIQLSPDEESTLP